MLTQVARSRVHCLVTAGDESISRILFSLSLSPYSFFSHTYFFFLSQSCKSIFTFIGEMYVVDTTWFPNSSMQENMGRESSPSHLLKVHGPVGKSSKFYPSVCYGGCFWPCCSSPYAFWRNIISRIPCQVLAGDSLLCWQEPGAKGQITISLNVPVYPPDVFSLHWSEVQNWKPCCSCCLWNPETSTSSLAWGNISISPLAACKCTDSHPFSQPHQEYSPPWV